MRMTGPQTWTTRDGALVPLEKMEDRHLAHSIAKIERSSGLWRQDQLPALKLEQAARRAGEAPSPIVGYLWRCWARDELKVDPLIRGWRTTTDLASAMDQTYGMTRRQLEKAYEAGHVDCRQDDRDQTIGWFAADTPEFRGWQVRLKVAMG